jgi:hypothetical protein
LKDLYALDTIDDVFVVYPTLPYATALGQAGVMSYLLNLNSLLAFAALSPGS